MKKKWCCPSCEYESGRIYNAQRHITAIHGDGVPVLTPGYVPDSNPKKKVASSNYIQPSEYFNHLWRESQPAQRPKDTYEEILQTLMQPNSPMKKMKFISLLNKYFQEEFIG